MKRISPLNPYTTIYNIHDREVNKVVVKTPEVINQHAEELERLSKENEELREEIKKLEKILEVLQYQIDELKANQGETQLIAVIEQTPPPAYKN